ncbi:2-oxoglutarate-dependent dioxygenase [Hibiscus syriacus]|uniref:2-oxoglutarate-dependent dioxygenase n=1 Tax=Hibiscus syriacus TaxID=106335 RepID=A0A6A3CXV3_HIBSY|nr:2-oxoglutarate-dependent dioxygenase [Hibiscus syriacus]
MKILADSQLHIPEFGENFCPPIYPLDKQKWQVPVGVPLICLHSVQIKPSPLPPSSASQTVIDCQPLMIHLQEESCLRIYSFLADGVVVNSGSIDGQPVDASLKNWTAKVSQLSLLLETTTCITSSPGQSSDSWRCVELTDTCIQLAMASSDGNPLTVVPPPGGLVRIGVACRKFRVSEKISVDGKNNTSKRNKDDTSGGRLIEKVPSDTAGMPLAQFMGKNLFLKVTHKTLGGAIAVQSASRWESVQVGKRAETWCFEKEDLGREMSCWHMTFQSLIVKAKSRPKDVKNVKAISQGMQRYPMDLVTVSVEGLQTLKPQIERSTLQDASLANGFKESLKIFGGINLEVHMVISEDTVEDKTINWVVENFKFSVKQPIEAIIAKDEFEHLAFLCKTEVDSMGRLAAGILRMLKFEKSLGKYTINKLGNLGIEEIFTPKCSQGSSVGSFGLSPSYKLMTKGQRTTLALLEEVVSDSQAKCAALVTESSNSVSFQVNLNNIEELKQKLDNMQGLLLQLQGHI